MKDPRKGLPSASGLERISLCPGSFLLEKQVPEIQTDDSESGTAVHAVLAGEAELSILDPKGQDTVEACYELLDKVCHEIFGHSYKECAEATRERRLWITHPETLEPILSAQCDLTLTSGNKTLVCDFKSLWGNHTAAASNWQLAAQIATVYSNYPQTEHEYFCAIIQPHGSPRVSVCKYSLADAAKAVYDVVWIATIAVQPNLPRTPGEKQCKFCRAAGICPELKAVTGSLVERTPEIVANVSNTDFTALLSVCIAAEARIAQIRSEAKRRLLEDPNALQGEWILSKPKILRPIIDPATVFERTIAKGVKQADFLKCVKITKQDLSDQLRAVTGLRGKPLTAVLEEVMADCCAERPSERSLARGTGKQLALDVPVEPFDGSENEGV